ncbi:DUF4091 domain-containing protein [Aestuariimicrobium sp. T2.26MG-19.2B]|uniref:DUF4091 domain-containing protein n=1 Tax=Aestuariimicrobium sp. T2.26MG-19.2B TaxID=3040679 RepID=UPI0024776D1F|nr:DUF4091 domain-containing protein [Aestuariimicrobium sp. T2.26MG-19.2B]CAI9405406.1 hypothetical protein AESSP_01406 [Aestuariimicrobium sp. T2.26MG-19.2B]
MSEHFTAVLVDDLEKVFPKRDPRPFDTSVPLTGHAGERISFQVAVRYPDLDRLPADEFDLTVSCAGTSVTLHRVALVPADMPIFPVHDDNYIDDVPGLYPDLLVPLASGEGQATSALDLRSPGWNSFWVDLGLSGVSAGPVAVRLVRRPRAWGDEQAGEGSLLLEADLPLEVTPVEAPSTPIRHIAWLHSDSLAAYYETPVHSELHWKAIGSHIASAADMGVTAVLTPVWTPSLDTAVGTYRPNVQLLGVWHDEDGYQFNTDLLDRFLGLLREHGIRQVEIAHLFTQWGARRTPQVWVDTAEGPQMRFGWHVAATDPAWREFLAEAIPFLRDHLEPEWGVENVLWHISDEPSEQHLEAYAAARAVVADLLEGAVIIDALSSPDFADVVDHPIVATDHVHDFLERGLTVRNVYYCVGQARAVSNRFIAQHAIGHRHLAAQMFVQGADTFLHWGYNFYWAQYAVRPIDPFRETSAGGRFPSGDPFVVYPGPEGECWPSLRHRVLGTMTHDARVMAWAEQLVGREAVLAIMDPEGSFAGERGYEAAWPDPVDYRRRRLELDRRVRAALGGR